MPPKRRAAVPSAAPKAASSGPSFEEASFDGERPHEDFFADALRGAGKDAAMFDKSLLELQEAHDIEVTRLRCELAALRVQRVEPHRRHEAHAAEVAALRCELAAVRQENEELRREFVVEFGPEHKLETMDSERNAVFTRHFAEATAQAKAAVETARDMQGEVERLNGALAAAEMKLERLGQPTAGTQGNPETPADGAAPVPPAAEGVAGAAAAAGSAAEVQAAAVAEEPSSKKRRVDDEAGTAQESAAASPSEVDAEMPSSSLMAKSAAPPADGFAGAIAWAKSMPVPAAPFAKIAAGPPQPPQDLAGLFGDSGGLTNLDGTPQRSPFDDLVLQLQRSHLAGIEELQTKLGMVVEPGNDPSVASTYDPVNLSPPSGHFQSTADCWNRFRDKARVEGELRLREEGDDVTLFADPKDPRVIVCRGYRRVLYGDHGPYVEFTKDNVCWDNFPNRLIKGPRSYYNEYYSASQFVKLYDQRKTVGDKPNPPAGRWSVRHNRYATGYSDYQPNMIYIAADSLVVARFTTPCAEDANIDIDSLFPHQRPLNAPAQTSRLVMPPSRSFDEGLTRNDSFDSLFEDLRGDSFDGSAPQSPVGSNGSNGLVARARSAAEEVEKAMEEKPASASMSSEELAEVDQQALAALLKGFEDGFPPDGPGQIKMLHWTSRFQGRLVFKGYKQFVEAHPDKLMLLPCPRPFHFLVLPKPEARLEAVGEQFWASVADWCRDRQKEATGADAEKSSEWEAIADTVSNLAHEAGHPLTDPMAADEPAAANLQVAEEAEAPSVAAESAGAAAAPHGTEVPPVSPEPAVEVAMVGEISSSLPERGSDAEAVSQAMETSISSSAPAAEAAVIAEAAIKPATRADAVSPPPMPSEELGVDMDAETTSSVARSPKAAAAQMDVESEVVTQVSVPPVAEAAAQNLEDVEATIAAAMEVMPLVESAEVPAAKEVGTPLVPPMPCSEDVVGVELVSATTAAPLVAPMSSMEIAVGERTSEVEPDPQGSAATSEAVVQSTRDVEAMIAAAMEVMQPADAAAPQNVEAPALPQTPPSVDPNFGPESTSTSAERTAEPAAAPEVTESALAPPSPSAEAVLAEDFDKSAERLPEAAVAPPAPPMPPMDFTNDAEVEVASAEVPAGTSDTTCAEDVDACHSIKRRAEELEGDAPAASPTAPAEDAAVPGSPVRKQPRIEEPVADVEAGSASSDARLGVSAEGPSSPSLAPEVVAIRSEASEALRVDSEEAVAPAMVEGSSDVAESSAPEVSAPELPLGVEVGEGVPPPSGEAQPPEVEVASHAVAMAAAEPEVCDVAASLPEDSQPPAVEAESSAVVQAPVEAEPEVCGVPPLSSEPQSPTVEVASGLALPAEVEPEVCDVVPPMSSEPQTSAVESAASTIAGEPEVCDVVLPLSAEAQPPAVEAESSSAVEPVGFEPEISGVVLPVSADATPPAVEFAFAALAATEPEVSVVVRPLSGDVQPPAAEAEPSAAVEAPIETEPEVCDVVPPTTGEAQSLAVETVASAVVEPDAADPEVCDVAPPLAGEAQPPIVEVSVAAAASASEPEVCDPPLSEDVQPPAAEAESSAASADPVEAEPEVCGTVPPTTGEAQQAIEAVASAVAEPDAVDPEVCDVAPPLAGEAQPPSVEVSVAAAASASEPEVCDVVPPLPDDNEPPAVEAESSVADVAPIGAEPEVCDVVLPVSGDAQVPAVEAAASAVAATAAVEPEVCEVAAPLSEDAQPPAMGTESSAGAADSAEAEPEVCDVVLPPAGEARQAVIEAVGPVAATPAAAESEVSDVVSPLPAAEVVVPSASAEVLSPAVDAVAREPEACDVVPPLSEYVQPPTVEAECPAVAAGQVDVESEVCGVVPPSSEVAQPPAVEAESSAFAEAPVEAEPAVCVVVPPLSEVAQPPAVEAESSVDAEAPVDADPEVFDVVPPTAGEPQQPVVEAIVSAAAASAEIEPEVSDVVPPPAGEVQPLAVEASVPAAASASEPEAPAVEAEFSAVVTDAVEAEPEVCDVVSGASSELGAPAAEVAFTVAAPTADDPEVCDVVPAEPPTVDAVGSIALGADADESAEVFDVVEPSSSEASPQAVGAEPAAFADAAAPAVDPEVFDVVEPLSSETPRSAMGAIASSVSAPASEEDEVFDVVMPPPSDATPPVVEAAAAAAAADPEVCDVALPLLSEAQPPPASIQAGPAVASSDVAAPMPVDEDAAPAQIAIEAPADLESMLGTAGAAADDLGSQIFARPSSKAAARALGGGGGNSFARPSSKAAARASGAGPLAATVAAELEVAGDPSMQIFARPSSKAAARALDRSGSFARPSSKAAARALGSGIFAATAVAEEALEVEDVGSAGGSDVPMEVEEVVEPAEGEVEALAAAAAALEAAAAVPVPDGEGSLEEPHTQTTQTATAHEGAPEAACEAQQSAPADPALGQAGGSAAAAEVLAAGDSDLARAAELVAAAFALRAPGGGGTGAAATAFADADALADDLPMDVDETFAPAAADDPYASLPSPSPEPAPAGGADEDPEVPACP